MRKRKRTAATSPWKSTAALRQRPPKGLSPPAPPFWWRAPQCLKAGPGNMPPISRRFDAEVGRLTVASPVVLALAPDLAAAGARRALAPLRTALRRSWFYRRLLKGQLTDHIAFYPHDAVPRRLEDADALLRGRFRFHGQTIDLKTSDGKQDCIFDVPPPSRAWAEALHSFAWLPPLALAGGEAARQLATALIAQWVQRHRFYSEPVWSPHVMARRLCNLFSHGRIVVVNSDMLWRSELFVALREQSRML